MRSGSLYCCILGFLFIAACESPKEMFQTEEFEKNNRSSDIDHRYAKDNLVHLLGYQVFKDTCFSVKRKDSSSTWSLVFDRNTNSTFSSECDWEFGNDSVKSMVHIKSQFEFFERQPTGVNWFHQSPEERQTTTGLNYAHIRGTIQYPSFSNEVRFSYDSHVGKVLHTGYLVINQDSFQLKPVWQGSLARTLLGLQLTRGNMIYGMIYSFTGIWSKHKAFIYTKATDDEQLIIAAYFATIDPYLQ